MFLMGDFRHRKFRSENLCSQGSKKEEWEKLMGFLKQELLLREKVTLDIKTAKVKGLSFENKDNQRDFLKRREYSKTYTGNNSSQTENSVIFVVKQAT